MTDTGASEKHCIRLAFDIPGGLFCTVFLGKKQRALESLCHCTYFAKNSFHTRYSYRYTVPITNPFPARL